MKTNQNIKFKGTLNRKFFCNMRNLKFLAVIFLLTFELNISRPQEININNEINILGQTKPIPVAVDGFSSEATEVLQFDLFVQGFSIVAPDTAQYLIHGTGSENVAGTVMDNFAHKLI